MKIPSVSYISLSRELMFDLIWMMNRHEEILDQNTASSSKANTKSKVRLQNPSDTNKVTVGTA